MKVKTVVWCCGLAHLTLNAALVILSYGIAFYFPYGNKIFPSQRAALEQLFNYFELDLGLSALRQLALVDSFASPRFRVAAYLCFMLAFAFIFAVAMRSIARNQDTVDDSVVSLLSQLCIASAALNVIAYPILTQDLWAYIVFGGMVLDGANPYYQAFSPENIKGSPLGYGPETTPYGPLWSLISGGLVFLSGGSVVAKFLLFKVLLLACWLLSLKLVQRQLVNPVDRAFATCIVGWLPASFHQSIGEGHNDIVMVSCLLLWLHVIRRGKVPRIFATLSLMVSALVKYVTLPLFVFDLVDARFKKIGFIPYASAMVVVALLGLLLFSPFFRDFDFFKAHTAKADWKFLTPAYAIVSVAQYFSLPVEMTQIRPIVFLVFLGIVIYHYFCYRSEPEFSQLANVILATICSILFLAHVWPWFVIWVLPLSMIATTYGLRRFVLAVAVVIPFVQLTALLGPWRYGQRGLTVLFYAAVVMVALLMPAGWLTRTKSRV